MSIDERPVLTVPARDVPVPRSLSEQAQAFLAMGVMAGEPSPAVDDHDGWRAHVAATEELVLPILEANVAHIEATIDEIDVGGVPVFVITPQGIDADDPQVLLEIHGGALISGSGPSCRAMGLLAADRAHARTWAVDYRLPPDDPYPAPLDDCVTVYRAMLERHRPEDIIVCGESAGGTLAGALILRARDEGLPLPGAALLITPELDLTESGDSFNTLRGVDNVMSQSLMPANLLYANGHDLEDPYVSPLFGDVTKGFPPTLLSAGTRDAFLSNAVRMHRKLRRAGIAAELHLVEAAPHGGFFGAPEDHDLDDEVRKYVDTCWGR